MKSVSSSPTQPTLCMIYDEITEGNGSIPQVALGYVKVALEANWRVTCVANVLDESVKKDVEWLPLHIAPKGFLVKWVTARKNITAAMGGRTWDVVHTHQAQMASPCDVMQCHYLTRVAMERNCLQNRPGFVQKLRRTQQQMVVRVEDFYFKRWNPRTRMLFNSALTRQEFARLYGMPSREEVFLCDVPDIRFPSDEERKTARDFLVWPNQRGLVIGSLGGSDKRKGFLRLIDGLRDEKEMFLLLGGPGSRGLEVPELEGRYKSLGMVRDTAQFFAACDVVIVPSLFEPFGLVATEASSHGVPVIATEEVGALPLLLEYGVGACWKPGESLGALARDLVSRRAQINSGARRLAQTFSRQKQGERLLQIYGEIRDQKLKNGAQNDTKI